MSYLSTNLFNNTHHRSHIIWHPATITFKPTPLHPLHQMTVLKESVRVITKEIDIATEADLTEKATGANTIKINSKLFILFIPNHNYYSQ